MQNTQDYYYTIASKVCAAWVRCRAALLPPHPAPAGGARRPHDAAARRLRARADRRRLTPLGRDGPRHSVLTKRHTSTLILTLYVVLKRYRVRRSPHTDRQLHRRCIRRRVYCPESHSENYRLFPERGAFFFFGIPEQWVPDRSIKHSIPIANTCCMLHVGPEPVNLTHPTAPLL